MQVIKSRPSRARGLKHSLAGTASYCTCVAPLAGAWIETTCRCSGKTTHPVAPLAGAWIETIIRVSVMVLSGGRAPRGRVD